jgi:DNA-directed RNA polymerase specialized sigma24 family protein
LTAAPAPLAPPAPAPRVSWFQRPETAVQLGRLWTALRQGEATADATVRAPLFRRATQTYAWIFVRHANGHYEHTRNVVGHEDLVVVCAAALLQALRAYDPERQVELVRYCTLTMYKACQASVRSRRQGLTQLRSLEETGGTDCQPHLGAHDREFDRADLRLQLGPLPELLARALTLHFLEGWSLAEMGARLAPEAPLSKPTVNRLVQRGLFELRRRLGVPAPPPPPRPRRVLRARLAAMRSVYRKLGGRRRPASPTGPSATGSRATPGRC